MMGDCDDNTRYYTVKEVCEAIGLSKSRFYQLLGTTFPWSAYLVTNHRPVFTEEQFQQCLVARRTNQGIDGNPVMFYSKRLPGPRGQSVPTKKPSKAAIPRRHAHVIEALDQLGLPGIRQQDIDSALKQLSINGSDADSGQVIAQLFRFFKAKKRQNTSDNVG